MSDKFPKPLVDLHATLSQNLLKCVCKNDGDISKFVKKFQKETGIVLEEKDPNLIISSSDYQVFKNAQNYLEKFMEDHHASEKSKETNPVKPSFSRSLSLDHEHKGKEPASASTKSLKRSDSYNPHSDSNTKSSPSESDRDTDHAFTVNSDIFAYIKHVHGEKVKNIEKKHDVKIKTVRATGTDSSLLIEPNESGSRNQNAIHEAKRKVGRMYQDLFPTIKCDSLESANESLLMKAAAEAQMKHPNVFIKQQGKTKIVFYAQEQGYIKAAQNMIKRSLGIEVPESDPESDGEEDASVDRKDVQTQQGRGHGSRQWTADHHGDHSASAGDWEWKSDRSSRPSEYQSGVKLNGTVKEYRGRLHITTSEGIKISVYKDDLTEQDTDVIVNAANENLQHAGGLAQAILRKAGRELQWESDDYVSYKGSVKVGSTIQTDAYNLKCGKIIHAVGPKWYEFRNKEDCRRCLQTTFLNCLHSADTELKATSIAIPAVSSGIFGVPKDVCADTLFNAVVEFLSSSRRHGSLREIRLVNIDRESTDLIKKKFKQNTQMPGSYGT
ncbi:uncharacterized protein [Ptychodera flava]|uniref:uncharacterized protein n=1 Tax=Ptychodera flava TaxID=63121 RepID=UPI00396A59F6